MADKKQTRLILIALCFLVYANSLNNAFVSDDIPAIVNNPLLANPLNYWLNPHALINSLSYLISGLNPFVYHLASIILHSLATLLVFSFLSLFFKAESSFLGAALFAVHPIHVEAVTWVSGRHYIVMTIFILSACLLYNSATNFSREKKWVNRLWLYYLLSLVLFAYYIVQNFTFYFLFPFFLLLFDFTFGRLRKNWIRVIPFFVILGLRLILAKSIISERISFVAKEAGATGVTLSNPIYNMAYSLHSHVILLVWPAKLTLYHEPAVIPRFALVSILVILSVAIVLLPVFFKKAKEVFFAIGIFVLFLAPTYSPVMIAWLVAERYVYFPSIALCIIFAFYYEKYSLKAGRLKKNPPRILIWVAIFIIAAFAVRTVARNEDWKMPERLWRQTVLVSPDSPRAHNNMGDTYYQEGNAEGAIREFKRAIEIKPDYADAYHNLANTYHKQGNLTEAVKFYKEAVRFNPGLFESHFDLGIIYLNIGELDAAIGHLQKASELRPDDSSALAALNFALKNSNR